MNIRRVKILGAGSIGNHLANASRVLGFDVVLCDLDPKALKRTQNEIYPGRYGKWDPAIQLCELKNAPKGGFDLICIGTPPEYHMPLALEALDEKPRAVQIEKPLCPPSLDKAQAVYEKAAAAKVAVFVGYDHAVGKAARKAEEILRAGTLGEIQTLDVEFREYWGGIFKAHPWLSGPADTYLGFWKRGGGSSGEHSHATNLWQHLAHLVGAGRVSEVSASVRYVKDGAAEYDDVCLMNLRTDSGFVGRVVQDVVTQPVKKVAWIHGKKGSLQWVNGYNKQGDAIIISMVGQPEPEIIPCPKTRPDDFIEELKHIDACLVPSTPASPISLQRGLDTMLAVAAAHLSEREKRTVKINYSRGYTGAALST